MYKVWKPVEKYDHNQNKAQLVTKEPQMTQLLKLVVTTLKNIKLLKFIGKDGQNVWRK